MSTEVESVEYAVCVNGGAVEWFKAFYTSDDDVAKGDAISYAEKLIEEGKSEISIERTVTYFPERDVIWGAGSDDEGDL
jgi:hypothetical protein